MTIENTAAETADEITKKNGNATGENGGDGGINQAQAKPDIIFKSEAEFQNRVDEILKERLEREKRKAEKAAEKAKLEAEAKALADQDEWQKLASKRGETLTKLEGRVGELEPQLETAQERIKTLEKTLAAQLEAQKDGLPDHILALLDKLDPVDQLDYIAQNAEALRTKRTPGGVDATPPPDLGAASGLSADEDKKAKVAELRRIRGWG